MPNHLSLDFRSAAIVPFRSARLVVERDGPLLLVGMEQLEIALLGVALLTGGVGGAQALALAFDEHGELPGELILIDERQGSLLADELVGGGIEVHWLASCGEWETVLKDDQSLIVISGRIVKLNMAEY